ncbi:SMI1/KNR4 family protein [Streptomyces sp. NPDC007189]|uniref:SMI1/KNR4 family protein n=1 Tax=Streptomyces sp. NPDC007189 TaxID=3154315 RepID=UPI0034545504
MATEIPGLVELWRGFENWLAEYAPGDYGSLLPGGSESDICRLENGLGFSVHEDVRTILRLHNGVTLRRASTEPGAFLLGYSLLDVEGILAAHRDLVSMVDDAREEGEEDLVVGRIADSQWVPFAQNMSGDLLFVDHRYHHMGEIGEMSFGDPGYQLLWPRMDLMMADLCESVKTRTPVTTVPRVPSVHAGRMLEWHVRPPQG